jgi:hypothetical protein
MKASEITQGVRSADERPTPDPATGRTRFWLIQPLMTNDHRRQVLRLRAVFGFSTSAPIRPESIRIHIGELVVLPRLRMRGQARARRHGLGAISFEVPFAETSKLDIHNRIVMEATTDDGQLVSHYLSYNALLRIFIAAHGPFYIDRESNTTAFFRQAAGRAIFLTCRHLNQTDYWGKRLKVMAAWLVARLPLPRPVLLYEKTAHRYEESAKTLFEYLMGEGQGEGADAETGESAHPKRIRYVINREAPQVADIPPAYRDHVIYQHTWKHYIAFFRCRTFIGTEAPSHCFELRTHCRSALAKLRSRRNTWVFLQHGVMYMVSLDSPLRSSFKRKRIPGPVRVVASSQAEADHFIELGGFDPRELIICGLPKFDHSYLNPGADKIMIMPTWRQWEFNQIQQDVHQSGYYHLIQDILGAIPPDLQDKVILLPHPLLSGEVLGVKNNLTQERSYDETLRDVRLLITDYSSISYDSFYRGAAVVFYWKDLADCMEHYGAPTHLMLNRGNAFGQVCMDAQELSPAIATAYRQGPSAQDGERFQHIVHFHDGKNTARLVARLRQDGIL